MPPESTPVLRDAGRVRAFEQRRLSGYVGVVAVSDDGTILHLTPALAGSLLWDDGALVGCSCLEMIHEADLEQAAESFAGTTERRGFHQPLTLRVMCGDGSEREVVVVAENLLDDPAVGAVIISIADSAEFGRIETLAIQNTTILEQIALDTPIEDTLDAIARWLDQQIPGGRCAVLLVDDETFRVAAAPSLDPVHRVALAGISVHDPGFLAAAAWGKSEALVIGTLPNGELATSSGVAAALDAQACWSVPIAHARGEAACGTIDVHHRDAVHPRPEEWSSLLLGARLAALAIESDRSRADLEHRAAYDSMTGLSNRHSIEARIASLAERGDGGAVMFLDIDRLKLVNDTLGHAVGDELIRSVADRLAAFGTGDVMVGRFGGDEFVLVVEPSTSAGVEHLAEQVLHQLRAPLLIGDRRLSATCSIGIARAGGGSSPATLLRDADLAMYDAKRAGGNCIRVCNDSLRATAARHLELEGELRSAISSDRIQVHYQPVVDLKSGRTVSIEALARWRWGERWVPPAEFIPVAEESGLILPLGEQVLRQACSALSALENLCPGLTVAVNLSPIQLQAGGTARLIADALEEWSIDPSRLCLEITESVLMSDEQSMGRAVQAIRALGVSVAIDDFGTGYSSLAYLRRLPVDVLKIDRAFVHDCEDPTGRAMLDIIGAIAQRLELRTVAEGVETAEQWAVVAAAGLDAVQGYLLSEPVPLAELAGVIARLDAGRAIPRAVSLPS